MSFAVEPSPEIWHRDDLPLLCNWRKLWRAAEVGVERGEWASVFLARWQGHQWWGVDPFTPYPEMPYDREADYLFTVERLRHHAGRAKLIRGGSVGSARLFGPGTLDFVYVDAAHDYESVRADLAAWWPAVAEGGIIAGHDFDDHPGHAGVRRAVLEFAEAEGLTVYVTAVEPYRIEECPSFYVYKGGMPGADWRRC